MLLTLQQRLTAAARREHRRAAACASEREAGRANRAAVKIGAELGFLRVRPVGYDLTRPDPDNLLPTVTGGTH